MSRNTSLILAVLTAVSACGAAPSRTIPRTVPTWADLANEDIRSMWQAIIVEEDGGVAVPVATASLPSWAVSSDYDKLARTDASGTGKWVRKFDGDVNVKWTGAALDGVTNDDAAWESAITVAEAIGCEVYMPAGTSIVSTLSITPATVNIAGESMDDCVIEADAYGTSSAEHWIPFTSITNISLVNLTFHNGFSTFYEDDPANFDHAVPMIRLENVKYVDSRHGLFYHASAAWNASASVGSIVAKNIHATADTANYEQAGHAVFYSNPTYPIPVRRFELEGFDFSNITEPVYLNNLVDSGDIRKGVVHDVAIATARGNVRGLAITGNDCVTTVDSVVFRDYVDPEPGTAIPSTFSCIYANGTTATVRNSKFSNIEVRDDAGPNLIDTKGDGGGRSVLIEECYFEDTNTNFTGRIALQASYAILRNNTWSGVAKNGAQYLLETTASDAKVKYLELSGNTFTNVTASSILRANQMASDGVAILQGNTFRSTAGSLAFITSAFAKLGVYHNTIVDDNWTYVQVVKGIDNVEVVGNYFDGASYSLYFNGGTGTVSIRDNWLDAAAGKPVTLGSTCAFSITLSGNTVGTAEVIDWITGATYTFGSGEASVVDVTSPLNMGDLVSYHGSTASPPANPTPGTIVLNTAKGQLGMWANGSYHYNQPLAEVTSGTLSGSVWLTPRSDNSVQIVSSAASTPEFLLSATNAVSGTVWRVVNQDGANTLDVDNTDGSTLIKTVGTSSWAELRWTGSTYVLVGYGSL